MTNREIAQEISNRIGNSPVPFDSVYSIALQIYNELGGDETQFDSVYSILLEILPLVEGGIASKVIDDNTISTEKTWSSNKINEEIQAVGGTADSEFDGKTTEDFHFVTELPQEATEGEQVVIRGENIDTLYKYVSGAWTEQTPDATVLYYDTENEALYSYVSAEQQFATISSVNTIVVGRNLNTSEALKAIKTPGTYSVLQRTSSTTKGEYTKKWTLTVEGVDYDEYELTDSVYQRIQSNYTIQKRTWSSTRTTNDGWTNFSAYYAGEIKDSTTSKYYTWSSNKISGELATKQDTLTLGTNIDITNNTISAKGYVYNASNGAFEHYNVAHDGDSSTVGDNEALGQNSVVFGQGNKITAGGEGSAIIGGQNNVISGSVSVIAGGYSNNVSGNYSFTEGEYNTVTADVAHAEGYRTKASGNYGSHAEGSSTIASGIGSHAEGFGDYSHNHPNNAIGDGSHVEGSVTIARNKAEHAEGTHNVSHKVSDNMGDSGNTLSSIGFHIGDTWDGVFKNAVEVMQNADVYIKGIGGYDGVHIKTETGYESTKTLQEYIASLEARIAALENPNA